MKDYDFKIIQNYEFVFFDKEKLCFKFNAKYADDIYEFLVSSGYIVRNHQVASQDVEKKFIFEKRHIRLVVDALNRSLEPFFINNRYYMGSVLNIVHVEIFLRDPPWERVNLHNYLDDKIEEKYKEKYPDRIFINRDPLIIKSKIRSLLDTPMFEIFDDDLGKNLFDFYPWDTYQSNSFLLKCIMKDMLLDIIEIIREHPVFRVYGGFKFDIERDIVREGDPDNLLHIKNEDHVLKKGDMRRERIMREYGLVEPKYVRLITRRGFAEDDVVEFLRRFDIAELRKIYFKIASDDQRLEKMCIGRKDTHGATSSEDDELGEEPKLDKIHKYLLKKNYLFKSNAQEDFRYKFPDLAEKMNSKAFRNSMLKEIFHDYEIMKSRSSDSSSHSPRLEALQKERAESKEQDAIGRY